MKRAVWRWIVLALAALVLLAGAELALRFRYRRRVLPRSSTDPSQVTAVVLGDSIPSGWPGTPEEAWPAILSHHLRADYPGVSWRILNAGVPGDTAPQGYHRFEQAVASAGPCLVLIGYGLNDCAPARHGLDRWFEETVPRGLGRSYVWRAVQVRARRWGQTAGWLPPISPDAHLSPVARTSPEGFVRSLAALVARTRDVGAQPVVLTMTPLCGNGSGDALIRTPAYTIYNSLIREFAARARIAMVELTGDSRPEWFQPDGLHLTAIGQAWVAAQVHRQLSEAGIWSGMAEEGRK